MSWNLLLTAIRTRATGDTGAGGLFLSGSELITGWYLNPGPQQDGGALPYPYVVVTPVSSVRINHFDPAVVANEMAMQFSVWQEYTGTVAAGQAIVDRIIARFDRWAPTVAGWTASQLICDSADIIQRDDYAQQRIVEFRCTLSK